MPRTDSARATPRPANAFRVLILIDDPAQAGLIAFALRHGSYEQRTAGTLGDARAALSQWEPHLVLVDIDVERGGAVAIIDDVS